MVVLQIIFKYNIVKNNSYLLNYRIFLKRLLYLFIHITYCILIFITKTVIIVKTNGFIYLVYINKKKSIYFIYILYTCSNI